MHDILLGVAFIAMFAAPAMVATLSGKKEYDPDPEPETAQPAVAKEVRKGEIIRPKQAPRQARIAKKAPSFQVMPTLPVHGRGMGNR